MTLTLTSATGALLFWGLVFAVGLGAVLGSAIVAVLGSAADLVVEWVEVRRASRAVDQENDARNPAGGTATRR